MIQVVLPKSDLNDGHYRCTSCGIAFSDPDEGMDVRTTLPGSSITRVDQYCRQCGTTLLRGVRGQLGYSCRRECGCPTRLHHEMYQLLERLKAPIPPLKLSAIIDRLDSALEDSEELNA